tara:strand:- start:4291 stop:4500 length:210 start_codon:yes stop_codon:yes gene_type:complete
MDMAFITQARDIQRNLHSLLHRAKEDESQFLYGLQQAAWNIDTVINTYEEVLQRDANEDESYRPSLKEV